MPLITMRPPLESTATINLSRPIACIKRGQQPLLRRSF